MIASFSNLVLLQANGHRVMTVSPRYDQYKDAWDTEATIEVAIYIVDHQTCKFTLSLATKSIQELYCLFE